MTSGGSTPIYRPVLLRGFQRAYSVHDDGAWRGHVAAITGRRWIAQDQDGVRRAHIYGSRREATAALRTPPPRQPDPRDIAGVHRPVKDAITESIEALAEGAGPAAAIIFSLDQIASRLDQLAEHRQLNPVMLWRELARIRAWCDAAQATYRPSPATPSITSPRSVHHHGG